MPIQVDSDQGVLALMIEEVGEWCNVKGWTLSDRPFPESVALLCSEAFEAFEAWRENGMEEWYTYQATVNGVKLPKMTKVQLDALGISTEGLRRRREGVGAELAGLFVRLLDECSRRKIDLFAEWRIEMDYNWTRAFRHGGKRA